MLASSLRRSWLLLLAEVALLGSATGADSPVAPVIIRIAVLPSTSEEVDREVMRLACQIGQLTPEFQNFRSFEECAGAWRRGETDAIAGITVEQAIVLGGRFLTAYREVRLVAMAPPRSLVLRAADLGSVTVATLPDGWGTLYAKARGWKPREVANLGEAGRALEERREVAVLDAASASILPSGYRKIDLGMVAPVSVAVPVQSPYARSLEMGLESLNRTGYMDRHRPQSVDGKGSRDWMQEGILVLTLMLMAGTGLIRVLRPIERDSDFPRPGEPIFAASR